MWRRCCEMMLGSAVFGQQKKKRDYEFGVSSFVSAENYTRFYSAQHKPVEWYECWSRARDRNISQFMCGVRVGPSQRCYTTFGGINFCFFCGLMDVSIVVSAVCCARARYQPSSYFSGRNCAVRNLLSEFRRWFCLLRTYTLFPCDSIHPTVGRAHTTMRTRTSIGQ